MRKVIIQALSDAREDRKIFVEGELFIAVPVSSKTAERINEAIGEYWQTLSVPYELVISVVNDAGDIVSGASFTVED